MNQVQTLVRKLPALCGAKDAWGRSGELQYLDELSNPELYQRVEGESFEVRIQSYAAFADYCTDRDKAFYGLSLLALIDANHQHDEVRAQSFRDQLSPLAGEFPDVDEIITFDQASVQTFWAP